MEPTDVTIEILKDIRSEIRETKHEIRETKQELHETREELSRRIVESEIRTSTAITELAGTVHDLVDVLRASHDLRPRVERCERDISDLKRRLP
jgi:hypothetical protein